jgi:hypothetical protein
MYPPDTFSATPVINIGLDCCNNLDECVTSTFTVTATNTIPTMNTLATTKYTLQYDTVSGTG